VTIDDPSIRLAHKYLISDVKVDLLHLIKAFKRSMESVTTLPSLLVAHILYNFLTSPASSSLYPPYLLLELSLNLPSSSPLPLHLSQNPFQVFHLPLDLIGFLLRLNPPQNSISAPLPHPHSQLHTFKESFRKNNTSSTFSDSMKQWKIVY